MDPYGTLFIPGKDEPKAETLPFIPGVNEPIAEILPFIPGVDEPRIELLSTKPPEPEPEPKEGILGSIWEFIKNFWKAASDVITIFPIIQTTETTTELLKATPAIMESNQQQYEEWEDLIKECPELGPNPYKDLPRIKKPTPSPATPPPTTPAPKAPTPTPTTPKVESGSSGPTPPKVESGSSGKGPGRSWGW